MTVRVKLTKRAVDAAMPRGKRYILWDSELPGFGLRVSPAGRKVFILSYRTASGKQRSPAIGTYGAITPHQAREIARDMLHEVAKGEDPSGRRQAARAAPTMNNLFDEFTEHHLPTLKPQTQRGYEKVIDQHLRPVIGGVKAGELSLADVQKLHRKFAATPRAANLAIAVLSSCLSFAERIQWRPVRSNPCQVIKRYPERKRHRALTADEFATLSLVLREAETPWSYRDESGIEHVVRDESPASVAVIRLALLTGMRRGEALGLRWSECDLENGRLNLSDSKTGAKTVPISTAAAGVIQSQPRVDGNPFVFPSPCKPGRSLSGITKPWLRIRARAGLEDVRFHDLRHSFAAMAASGDLTLHQIGQLLGHANPGTTQRYSGLIADHRRALAEKVGAAVADAMAGKTPPK